MPLIVMDAEKIQNNARNLKNKCDDYFMQSQKAIESLGGDINGSWSGLDANTFAIEFKSCADNFKVVNEVIYAYAEFLEKIIPLYKAVDDEYSGDIL